VFPCTDCEETFKSFAFLKLHLKNKHGKAGENLEANFSQDLTQNFVSVNDIKTEVPEDDENDVFVCENLEENDHFEADYVQESPKNNMSEDTGCSKSSRINKNHRCKANFQDNELKIGVMLLHYPTKLW
jgi:hypothetical protein